MNASLFLKIWFPSSALVSLTIENKQGNGCNSGTGASHGSRPAIVIKDPLQEVAVVFPLFAWWRWSGRVGGSVDHSLCLRLQFDHIAKGVFADSVTIAWDWNVLAIDDHVSGGDANFFQVCVSWIGFSSSSDWCDAPLFAWITWVISTISWAVDEVTSAQDLLLCVLCSGSLTFKLAGVVPFLLVVLCAESHGAHISSAFVCASRSSLDAVLFAGSVVAQLLIGRLDNSLGSAWSLAIRNLSFVHLLEASLSAFVFGIIAAIFRAVNKQSWANICGRSWTFCWRWLDGGAFLKAVGQVVLLVSSALEPDSAHIWFAPGIASVIIMSFVLLQASLSALIFLIVSSEFWAVNVGPGALVEPFAFDLAGEVGFLLIGCGLLGRTCFLAGWEASSHLILSLQAGLPAFVLRVIAT